MSATNTPTKRSASGSPLIQRMSSLYKPDLVSVIIGQDKHEFQVPKGLICSMSEYFDKAFHDHFREGQDNKIELPDVSRWVFACFIGWLYAQKIFWVPSPEYEQQPRLDDGIEIGDNVDVTDADLVDPTTWTWEHLFELYVFADAYDTQALRTDVMRHIQVKAFQTEPRGYNYPTFAQLSVPFASLPTCSTLYEFLSDLVIRYIEPGELSSTELTTGKLPASALAYLFGKALQVSRLQDCGQGLPCNCEQQHPDITDLKGPNQRTYCAYHEHRSVEEDRQCQKLCESLQEERMPVRIGPAVSEDSV